jgi:predicted RNase H-like HicB family nuclease
MVATVTTYEARAVRDGKWWVVTVPTVPGAFSQVRRLDQVEDAITEAITFVAGVSADQVEVQVDVDLAGDLLAQVRAARAAVAGAEAAQRDAAERSRAAARRLVAAGLSGYDAARVMGVSPQRISQLTKGATVG